MSLEVTNGERGRREEVHVKMEAAIGVMWPQAKECQEPPETGGGREGFSPRDVGGSETLLTV